MMATHSSMFNGLHGVTSQQIDFSRDVTVGRFTYRQK
jgi:hypothetical protein